MVSSLQQYVMSHAHVFKVSAGGKTNSVILGTQIRISSNSPRINSASQRVLSPGRNVIYHSQLIHLVGSLPPVCWPLSSFCFLEEDADEKEEEIEGWLLGKAS